VNVGCDRHRAEARSLLLIVHSDYPIEEARVRRQAEVAVREGWAVDVFALASPGRPTRELINGVAVHRSRTRRVRKLSRSGIVNEYGRFWLEAAAFCTRVPRIYRTIVVANPPDFLVFVTLRQKLRGALIILDVHDLMTDLFAVRLSKSMGSFEVRLLMFLERASCRFANRVMTVHEPYKREILRRSGAKREVAVVMNSADDTLFRARDSEPEEPPIICYHGSILARYGVFDLLQAFTSIAMRYPDVQLWLLGGGDARDELEAEAERLGLRDRCRFSPGFLPAEEIAELLARVHIGVIPNRPNELNRYALSTKLFEYVAVGVPVVCARLETLAGHFGEDELLFFTPASVHDLTAKLEEALANREGMRVQARRARRHYRDSYSWEENSATFLKEIDG
jgi:glycosyltransferase involved in cell wall biosynthesis